MEPQTITHTLSPIFNQDSRVLILGTMPSPQSRKQGFYYGHPQNRFWRVLACVFNEPVPQTNDERATFITHHHLALWDVLASCTIAGASDASITHPVPNDLGHIVRTAPISTIVTTGNKASQLLKRFYRVSPRSSALEIAGKSVIRYDRAEWYAHYHAGTLPHISNSTLIWIPLPSTSPANAAMSFDVLVDAYQILYDLAFYNPRNDTV